MTVSRFNGRTLTGFDDSNCLPHSAALSDLAKIVVWTAPAPETTASAKDSASVKSDERLRVWSESQVCCCWMTLAAISSAPSVTAPAEE